MRFEKKHDNGDEEVRKTKLFEVRRNKRTHQADAEPIVRPCLGGRPPKEKNMRSSTKQSPVVCPE